MKLVVQVMGLDLGGRERAQPAWLHTMDPPTIPHDLHEAVSGAGSSIAQAPFRGMQLRRGSQKLHVSPMQWNHAPVALGSMLLTPHPGSPVGPGPTFLPSYHFAPTHS